MLALLLVLHVFRPVVPRIDCFRPLLPCVARNKFLQQISILMALPNVARCCTMSPDAAQQSPSLTLADLGHRWAKQLYNNSLFFKISPFRQPRAVDGRNRRKMPSVARSCPRSPRLFTGHHASWISFRPELLGLQVYSGFRVLAEGGGPQPLSQ